jgi:hypothetical protein
MPQTSPAKTRRVERSIKIGRYTWKVIIDETLAPHEWYLEWYQPTKEIRKVGEPDYVVFETPSTKARWLVKLGEKIGHQFERQVPWHMLTRHLKEVEEWAEIELREYFGKVVTDLKKDVEYKISYEQGLVTTLGTLVPIANHDLWRLKDFSLDPREDMGLYILRTIIFYQEIIPN